MTEAGIAEHGGAELVGGGAGEPATGPQQRVTFAELSVAGIGRPEELGIGRVEAQYVRGGHGGRRWKVVKIGTSTIAPR